MNVIVRKINWVIEYAKLRLASYKIYSQWLLFKYLSFA